MGMNEIAEEEREFALRALLHVGALTTCEFHEDEIFEGSADVENAYKYANKLYSESPGSLTFEDRREMTDMILRIYQEYGGCDTCASCPSYDD